MNLKLLIANISRSSVTAACQPRTAPALCFASPQKLRCSSRIQNQPRSGQKTQVFDGLKSFLSPEPRSDRTPPMVPLEDNTSVINAGEESEPFGPLAILLVGFMEEEVEKFRGFLTDMEAHMVKVIPATKAMMLDTLGAALEAEAPAYEQPPLGTRRAILLSGMYGAEIVSTLECYRDSGLPPAVFACAVPNSYDRRLGEVLEECHEDHAWHMKRDKEGPGADDEAAA